jgi:subtilisin family serine protease
MHVDKSLSLRLLSMAALFVAVTWTVASAQTTDPQANPAPARPAAKAIKPVKPPAAARIPPRGVPPGRAIGTRPAGRLPATAAPSLPARTATPPLLQNLNIGGRTLSLPTNLNIGTRPPFGANVNVPGAATAPGRIAPGPALPGGASRSAALPPGGGAPALNSRTPLTSPRQNTGAPPLGGANARDPAARLRQSSLPRPGGALPRPGVALPRSTATLPRGAGRFGGSPAWTAMRQRYLVAPPRSAGPPPGLGIGRTRHEMSYSGVPPRGEVRFVSNEVVVQIANTVPRAQVETVARQLGVAMVATHGFDAAGRTLYQFRASDGRDVRDVIRQLERNRIVAAAQPNYVYQLDQNAPAPTSLPPRVLPDGDPGQYVIERLHLGEVHRLARGRNVSIAVIDSEIDEHHPDLEGAIAEHFDPSGQPSRPHTHGTGMAGAIVAKSRLLGVAPDASIVAIKAFDDKRAGAEATSFQILKGLDYAVRRGVRIINMSFAGPYDVMMERKLREAYDKGIVLVAAAGNAGPKSPPLYPAADPSVIAVTATDYSDKPFAMANRGNYIAIAAPGVDIMVPAPGGIYQLTTGTSVAAAHVSGVIALMLEKRPELTPEDVRAVLAGSAKTLSTAADNETGAGLIDPVQALSYEPPAAETPPVAQVHQPAAGAAAR